MHSAASITSALGVAWAIVIFALRALKSTGGAGGGRFANLDVSSICVECFVECFQDIESSAMLSQSILHDSIRINPGVALMHYLDKYIPRSYRWPARAEPRLPLPLCRRRCVWSLWSRRGSGTLGCKSRLEFSAYHWPWVR